MCALVSLTHVCVAPRVASSVSVMPAAFIVLPRRHRSFISHSPTWVRARTLSAMTRAAWMVVIAPAYVQPPSARSSAERPTAPTSAEAARQVATASMMRASGGDRGAGRAARSTRAAAAPATGRRNRHCQSRPCEDNAASQRTRAVLARSRPHLEPRSWRAPRASSPHRRRPTHGSSVARPSDHRAGGSARATPTDGCPRADHSLPLALRRPPHHRDFLRRRRQG
jgi:hypothetical protein